MWKLSLLLLLSACALAEEPAKSSEESAEQYRELEIDDLIKNLEVRLNAQKDGGNKIDDKDMYEVVTVGPVAEEEAQGFPRCTRQKAYRDPRDRAAYKAYVAARSRPKKRIDYDPAEIDEIRKEAYGLCNEQAPVGNHLSDFERQEQCYRALLRLRDIYRVDDDLRLRPHHNFPPMKLASQYLSRDQASKDNLQLADRLAESALQLARKRLHAYPCDCPACSRAKLDLGTPLSIPIPTEPPHRVGHSGDWPKRDTTSDAAAAILTSVADAAADVANNTGEVAKETVAAAATAADPDAPKKPGGELVGTGKLFGEQYELMTCEEFERKMIMDTAIEQAAALIRDLALKTNSEYIWRSEPDLERQVLETAVELVNKITYGITGANQDQIEGFKYKDADDYLRSANVDVEEVYEAVPLSNAGFDYVHPAAARLDGRKLYDGIDGYGDYVSPYARSNCESCSRYDLRMSGMCPLCKRGSKEEDRAKVFHLQRTAEVPKKIVNLRRTTRKQ